MVPYDHVSSLVALSIPVVEIVSLTVVEILNTSEIGGEEIHALSLAVEILMVEEGGRITNGGK